MKKETIDYNSHVNQDIKQKLVAREVIHRCNIMIDELKESDMQDEILEKFYSNYDEESGYYFEPYEFWAVTDWFGKKLAEQGELVEELFDFTIWARGTTGQAISLDYVVSKIAEQMEILDGQQYSWADRK